MVNMQRYIKIRNEKMDTEGVVIELIERLNSYIVTLLKHELEDKTKIPGVCQLPTAHCQLLKRRLRLRNMGVIVLISGILPTAN
jgi:hypothetical protein